jgi:hypothetical protein
LDPQAFTPACIVPAADYCQSQTAVLDTPSFYTNVGCHCMSGMINLNGDEGGPTAVGSECECVTGRYGLLCEFSCEGNCRSIPGSICMTGRNGYCNQPVSSSSSSTADSVESSTADYMSSSSTAAPEVITIESSSSSSSSTGSSSSNGRTVAVGSIPSGEFPVIPPIQTPEASITQSVAVQNVAIAAGVVVGAITVSGLAYVLIRMYMRGAANVVSAVESNLEGIELNLTPQVQEKQPLVSQTSLHELIKQRGFVRDIPEFQYEIREDM